MGELIDKAKGKLKQAEGKLTGNKARQAEGVADELKGKAKGKFEEVKADIKRALGKDDDALETAELDSDEDEVQARRSRVSADQERDSRHAAGAGKHQPSSR